MLMGEDSCGVKECNVVTVDQECSNVVEDNEVAGEISLYALAGSKSMETLRLQGSIKGKRVSILIDSGSTLCIALLTLV